MKNVWGVIRHEFSRLEPGVIRRTMELDCRAHPCVARARRRSCPKPGRGRDEPVGDLRRAIATGVRMAGGCGAAAGSCAGLPRTDFRRRLTLPGGRIGTKAMLRALLLAHDHAAACLPVCSGTLE